MKTAITTIRDIEIASRVRRGSPTAIVLIHGLGDAGNSFEPLFQDGFFRKFTLAAVDMPGCGLSAKPRGFSYSMKDQADIVLLWLRELEAEKVILAGHSMGGVISLYTTENSPEGLVTAFVNIEGNLGPEDCMFSGRIASYSEDDFKSKGFNAFVGALKRGTASDPRPVMRIFAQNFSRALPEAVYRSSLSLVEESRNGRLKERFRDLSVARGYITGERSLVSSTAKYLTENNIPHFTVPDSGHFMMIEQPEAFCDAFRRTLEAMGINGV